MSAEEDLTLRDRMAHVMKALRDQAHDQPTHSGGQYRAGLEEAANAIQMALGDDVCRCVPHNGNSGMLKDPGSSMWCLHGTPDPAYQKQFGRPSRPVPRWVPPRTTSGMEGKA
jgi:hypothetical protein